MSKATPYFNEVTSQVDSDDLERGILSYWEKEKIFEQSLEQNKKDDNSNVFTFYDGPPYATGKPHYGHVLQSAIKDTVLRYKTMQGYYVPRRVGWDCHGLPVETLVEKELGIKTKKDIEKMGVEKFNAACREVVTRYIDVFTSTLQRIGRWADYDNAYKTLDQNYMESEWWVFKQLWEQGLVYKAFRSTPYCIRCATPLSNFEVSSNYQQKHDTAVYVLLKIQNAENLHAVVWTTTPWTLPGNVAVAFNPEVKYVTVEVENKQLLLAKERVAAVIGSDAKVTKEWTVDELAALTYEPLYQFLPADNAFRFVEGPHVTADDGTGLVHMAPAFGEEDKAVADATGLPILRTVDTEGKFITEVTPWAGQNIFDANKDIVKDLEKKEILFKKEHYEHSYPFCWRCDQPLIYYALDTWFVKITDIKERMLADNEKINWVPEHVKEGRFKKGIESAPDWAVSRNRFWSVPLPVWECDKCEHRQCVGSITELEELSGEKEIADIHRPIVDDYSWSCSECDGTMHRVEEVLDVWFDSGSMPYSQWHYPFENKAFVEQNFPADFIAESIEMTRAWFYVLHVLATALTGEKSKLELGNDEPAFKNAIASGLIFAEDGRKLSKKLKNYPEIDTAVGKYGADALRFYLLASASLGEPYRFSEKELQTLRRNMYLTLWNVYSFFMRYAATHEWIPSETSTTSTNLLDQWMLARVQLLENQVLRDSGKYRIDAAARHFVSFVDDLSNWYVRRSRARFQKPTSEEEKNEAFGTLYNVLLRTSTLLAPFMPFVSEEMYRNLTKKPSVHLASLPSDKNPAELSSEQQEILQQMSEAREIVGAGLRLRAAANIKVRQPLQALYVGGTAVDEKLSAIIKDEVNVKEILFGEVLNQKGILKSDEESKIKVGLNTVLSDELKGEGYAREIIRHGQTLRRQAGLALDQKITLQLEIADTTLKQLIDTQLPTITQALQAETTEPTVTSSTAEEFQLNGTKIKIGISTL